MPFTILPPPAAPTIDVSGLATDAELAAAIAAAGTKPWIPLNLMDADEWFFRPVPGNQPLTRLSFQANIPKDPAIMDFFVDDFVEGYATDGYYTSPKTLNGVPIAGPQPYQGGLQRGYTIKLSGSLSAYVVVAVYPSNHFLIAAQLGVSPYTVGRIRNIYANGVSVE